MPPFGLSGNTILRPALRHAANSFRMLGESLLEIVDKAIKVPATGPMHAGKLFLQPRFRALKVPGGEHKSARQDERRPKRTRSDQSGNADRHKHCPHFGGQRPRSLTRLL